MISIPCLRPFSWSIALGGALLLGLQGCGSGGEYDQAPAVGKAGREMSYAAQTEESAPPAAIARKIIYIGSVNLRVENLDEGEAALESLVKEFKGYLGGADKRGRPGTARTGTWTIRVPSSSFNSFMKSVAGLGELEESSRTAQDVTEEYVDIEARLKNKKTEEARIAKLLAEATGKLTDVLQVEKELSRVRGEVEQIEGRLRFLANQVELSTLTVSMSEVKGYVPQGEPSVGTRVARSFSGSVEAMKEFGISALVALVAILPWAAPLGLVVGVVVFSSRKGRDKKTGKDPQAGGP
jgi:hypothetical protein